MLLRLLTLFIVLPLVELALLLKLADLTGIWFTLSTVIVTGIAGTALARVQGLRAIRAIQQEVARGQMPAEALLDAILILCAGALLLTPGLLTDAVGLATLVPQLRRRLRAAVTRWIRRRFDVVSATDHDHQPDGQTRVLDVRILDSHDVE